MLTESIVQQAFAPLVSGEGSFLNYVADDVRWTLTGIDDPLVGTYTSKADLANKVFAPLYAKVDGALAAKIVSVLISADWAVVEFTAEGKTKGGGIYNQELCWVCRFEGDKIVQVREYLDSAQVKRVLEE